MVINMNPKEEYENIFKLLREHHQWIQNTINLIASENIPSPAVREAISTDFSHRYAEGWPGERVYAGCKYIDQVEIKTMELAKQLFKAEFADVRPISGVVANLMMYTACTEPGDRIFALSIQSGGHISHARRNLGGTAGAVHGLKVQNYVYDEKELNIDVDASIKKIRELEKEGKHTKLLLFGASVLLFPHPVKEFQEIAQEYNMRIGYDAAHVAGLIAGGQFQDPLREGADVMTASTHKTLPGPQHGIVLSKKEYSEKIKHAAFPSLMSNHHLHNVAGLGIAIAEMLEFGQDYAKQIIKNAKALAQSLYERGFNVLGEHKGFTESHIVLIDITNTPLKDGRTVEEKLEKANIIINRNLLPWDKREGRDYIRPGGIRLGVSEMTRLGMKESEMDAIAEFIKKVVIDEKDPKSIAKDVSEFRKPYQKVQYCFDNKTDAYAYISFR